MSRHFEQRAIDADARWDSVALDVSFRSTAAVLEAVDATFAQPDARDGLDADAVRHVLTRDGEGGLVELWPLAPAEHADAADPWRPEGTRDVVQRPEFWLAWAIATRIHDWLARGEILESRGRPIKAGDIMILVRRRTQFVEALVNALKSFGVEVAGVDRMVLTDQLAIMDLMALGRFLLLPEDDLTLAAVLKSPLVGLDEDDLFALAYGRGGRLWDELRRRRDEPRFGPAHEALATLLARADYVPPFELYSEILGQRGGREQIVARLGVEANDPIDEFLGRAFEYERVHPPSLQGFLEWLAGGEAEIKRDLEHGVRDEVRIMTVHGAKGLQAPVVFLADTTQVPQHSPRLLWSEGDGEAPLPLWPPQRERQEALSRAARAAADRERDREHRRLLYVAMTRAADRLYVCGWAGGRKLPDDCWYELVCRGLKSVAEPVEIAVRAAGSSGWKGIGLRLATPQTSAAPRHETDAIEAAVPPLPGWARTPAPAELLPARPLIPSRPTEPDPPALSPLARDGVPFRRGLLVHRLLELLPGLAPALRSDAARRFLARPIHGLSEEEKEAIVAETLGVLEAPDAADLFGPRSRAEVPVVGVVGGQVVSGRIDRLVVSEREIRLVDFKTNRPVADRQDAVPTPYLRQLALYRALIAKIYPKLTITSGILWTAGPRLMWITEDRLAGAILDATPPQT
jgi:ATP-dependent helicase/nuclease subunit A